MATRSTIACENKDYTISMVYCHWDGYLEHNGKILLENYDWLKTQELIGLGSLSILAKDIGQKHDFNEKVDCCKFYGRDRGEKNTEATEYENFDAWLQSGLQQEFDYILRLDGQWYVRFNDNGLVLVKDTLQKLNQVIS